MKSVLDAPRRFVELVFNRTYEPDTFDDSDFWDAFAQLDSLAKARRPLPPGTLPALLEAAANFGLKPGAEPEVVRAMLAARLGHCPLGPDVFARVLNYLRGQVNGDFGAPASNRRRLLGFE